MQSFYPVIDCYATVQGEGQITGGDPIILVRLSTLDEWHNAHILTERKTPFVKMELASLVTTILNIHKTYPKISVVHVTGDEPCLTDIPSLFKALRNNDLGLSLDTCGAFLLPQEVLDSVEHLSVGPKPYLPLQAPVYNAASEVRLYVKHDDTSFEMFIRSLSNSLPRNTLLIPYTLGEEDINATLALVLELGFKFHLPTYRTMYGFDKDLNGGQACNICNIQDGKTPITFTRSVSTGEVYGMKDVHLQA